MKTKYYLLLSIAFAISFNACKKSSTDKKPETPTVKQKYLTKATAVITSPGVSGSYTQFTDYTYDSQKRLITVKTVSQANNYDFTANYTYNGGQLYSIVSESGGSTSGSDVFSYNNDGTIKSVIQTVYRNNAVFNTVEWDYVYKDGKVSETHHDLYYETYTYDSHNNVSKVFNHGVTDLTLIYTYDDKKNKFTGSLLKSVISGAMNAAGDRYSQNNLVHVSSDTNPNGGTVTTYVYDADGYPTGGSQGTADNGSKFSYVYSTL